ncbi:hypothetical protein Tco_0352321 [Tanacetum coccineum]
MSKNSNKSISRSQAVGGDGDGLVVVSPGGSEIYTKGARKYWKIIRFGNHTEVYQFFDDMLKAFDREDLVKLWSLVKEKFNSTEPTKDKEREIWVELKRLFEPDTDDEL